MVYLAGAMVFIWVLAFGYLLYIGKRADQLESEIRMLEDLLEDLLQEEDR